MSDDDRNDVMLPEQVCVWCSHTTCCIFCCCFCGIGIIKYLKCFGGCFNCFSSDWKGVLISGYEVTEEDELINYSKNFKDWCCIFCNPCDCEGSVINLDGEEDEEEEDYDGDTNEEEVVV
eukprot:TRINITY_DN1507_c2_g1_i1.p1 TRINITY_DN1507_c2_g1~~TRINITY_DN1507_c2_g1_i1.p1  ORF type:complete len:120 (+),score=36.84 TRINITY_DN1507_c2_g1_i1:193-552(+)